MILSSSASLNRSYSSTGKITNFFRLTGLFYKLFSKGYSLRLQFVGRDNRISSVVVNYIKICLKVLFSKPSVPFLLWSLGMPLEVAPYLV